MMEDEHMEIMECKNYHAICCGTKLAKMFDRKSVFKIYYISIVGRDNPEVCEWEHCALSKDTYYNRFLACGHTGMGFVTAFPTITKVFRFSPARETVLDVKVFDSLTLTPTEYVNDKDGFSEFACYAEAAIVSKEYQFWAKCTSVEEYLKQFCSLSNFPVKTNCKLKEYWN